MCSAFSLFMFAKIGWKKKNGSAFKGMTILVYITVNKDSIYLGIGFYLDNKFIRIYPYSTRML